ncbi:acylphosphatase-2 isoform X1 [Phyllostomus hastatus]|uniref:acylphosphatase-2 isoform X1 n=1 Tax=Phyllostomus hastatus TaxID=9423 RepID=UPI001E6810E6|nr:acylphosphatase-2 isoform X1 [Phyllostomus hastatus]
MCPLLLTATAVAVPRTSLQLLGRGLAAMSTAGPLKSVDYEVFGRVQGVCFRMYTEGEAKKIGVVGWVKNTSQGTVTGQVQGPEEKVNSIESPNPKQVCEVLHHPATAPVTHCNPQESPTQHVWCLKCS